MYCPRCRATLEREDRRCWACGRRLGPSITRPAFYTVVVAVLAVVLAVGVNRLWAAAEEHGDAVAARKHRPPTTTAAPAATPAPTAPAPTAAPRPGPVTATAAASAESGPAQNGCGETTTYEAAKVLDRDPHTAWRTGGDGTG